MPKKRALILVDLQNDFCEGGSMAVKGSEEIIPLANKLQEHFDLIIATKDWHPQNHLSFASNHSAHQVGDVVTLNGIQQVLWPNHCVQESGGAAFHPRLDTKKIQKVFFKGVEKTIDSYSAFFDNAHLRSTGLGEYLKALQVEEVYLLGLATDYCVKYSALDATKFNFEVFVIVDACRGIELNPGDIANALTEMTIAGVKLTLSPVLL